MKKKTNMILFAAFLVFFYTGCGVDDTVYFEQTVMDTAVCEQETEAVNDVWPATTEVPETQDVGSIAEAADEIYYVYICGAVLHPGVYEMPQGSRVYEVVSMAGGLTSEASENAVNQAAFVEDGQMIFWPTAEEAAAGMGTDALSALRNGTDAQATGGEEPDGRVNINTATASELMTLPGIGQTKAERILAYRDAHGSFSSVEEIMKVDGIKEGLYNRIKDDIRVK